MTAALFFHWPVVDELSNPCHACRRVVLPFIHLSIARRI